jgi:hypothetical protein
MRQIHSKMPQDINPGSKHWPFVAMNLCLAQELRPMTYKRAFRRAYSEIV